MAGLRPCAGFILASAFCTVCCGFQPLGHSGGLQGGGIQPDDGTGPSLPFGHPQRLTRHNAGLPDLGCLTFEERYRFAASNNRLNSDFAAAYALHPSTQYAVLVKLHGEARLLKQDLLLSLLALALEATEAGFHIYILYQIPDDAAGHAAEEVARLPRSLQTLVFPYTNAEVYAKYAHIPGLLAPAGTWLDYFPNQKLAYLPLVHFVQAHQRYRFFWVVEYDVRYTGHWGALLGSALNLATNAPREFDGGVELVHGELVATNLPDPTEAVVPDIVNFLPLFDNVKWTKTQIGVNFSTVPESLFMVWGGSRALFNAMHAWSLEGKACFYECFMGLVAREEGLRSVAVGHPAFGGPSYHCDAKVAEELYQRWSNTSSECLHSVLLHPIKLESDAWPKPNAAAAAKAAEVHSRRMMGGSRAAI